MEERSGLQKLIITVTSNFHRWASDLFYYAFKIAASAINAVLDQFRSYY